MIWDMTWEDILEKVMSDLSKNCFCKTCNQGHNDYTKPHNSLIFSQKSLDTPIIRVNTKANSIIIKKKGKKK